MGTALGPLPARGVRELKNKKVELDLERVLGLALMWAIILGLTFVGMTFILGHVASVFQTFGALALIFAVYLLMPTKDEDA